MKQKTLIILLGMIFLIGIMSAGVGADRIISNLPNEITINDFIAGDTTTANFSFDYLNIPENQGDSPLIIKINLSTLDFGENCSIPDCSVLKGDFELAGAIKRYWIPFFGGFIYRDTILLNCYEDSSLIINHPYGPTTLDVPDGIFYCYNPQYNNLDLDEHDEVTIYLKSHQALYPGNYLMTAELFYINDTESPIVNITNKNYFETTYFKQGKDIEITATIEENAKVKDFPFGRIFTTSENFNVPYSKESEGIYYFFRILPNIPEGEYEMKVFAEDESGNKGNDMTILKIDLTGPEIIVLKPEQNKSYNNALPIELNVSDWKSGVDNSSVKFRIREITNGSICPESGGGFNYECLNTGWLNTTMTSGNSSSGIYKTTFNITNWEEGVHQFWFEAKAKDILGNEGEWVK